MYGRVKYGCSIRIFRHDANAICLDLNWNVILIIRKDKYLNVIYRYEITFLATLLGFIEIGET